MSSGDVWFPRCEELEKELAKDIEVTIHTRAADKVLQTANPWGWCGFKNYGKHLKIRANRRYGNNICRDWELYW